MRLSQLLITPGSSADAEQRADLLTHAGYTLPLAEGVYTLLPLGQRVLARICAIIRRELERSGAHELLMPLLQPASLWERPLSDGHTRAAAFGPQLFCVDGHERWVLAPTHEEVAAVVAAACVRDARDLPRVFFQIQPRFRDQACPPGSGLLRTREFVMADAYSFHADRVSLDLGYGALRAALCSALARCGAEVEVVRADGGAMGGYESEELLLALPSAPVVAVRCAGCGDAASTEIAAVARARPIATAQAHAAQRAPLTEVAAPDERSVDETAALLGVPAAMRLTWVPFVAAGRVILAVVAGSGQINAVKLARALTAAGIAAIDLHPASLAELTELGASYASISLVQTPGSVLIVADSAIRDGAGFWLPSTRVGHVLIAAEPERDFRVDLFTDLGLAQAGDACLHCGAALRAIHGVEVGHVFKLGTDMTRAFGAQIADDSAGPRALEMGCYGLGITRLMAAIAEQRRDARGIVWPERVAPYAAMIVPHADGDARRVADSLHADLGDAAADVLLDDSELELDVRLRRADMLGLPWQLIVSAAALELRERATHESRRLSASEAASWLRSRAERVL